MSNLSDPLELTADGVRALVLELVEGPTLADKLTEGSSLQAQGSRRRHPSDVSLATSGGLPVGEALPIEPLHATIATRPVPAIGDRERTGL